MVCEFNQTVFSMILKKSHVKVVELMTDMKLC